MRTMTDRTVTPPELRASAYHEAGHAVAHFARGRRIDRVSIVPDEDGGSLGHVRGRILLDTEKWRAGIREFDTPRERRAAEDTIIAALAGPIAEAKLTGRRNRAGAAGDYERVGDLLDALDDGDDAVAAAHLNFLEVLAAQLIDRYWPLVEVLAEELLARGTLSGSAVREVLRRTIRAESERRGMP